MTSGLMSLQGRATDGRRGVREAPCDRNATPAQPSALAARLPEPEQSFFDFGCGRGGDVRHLRQLAYDANGWDPGHAQDAAKTPAAVVNLGYVVNVIEDPVERAEALRAAWKLTREVLVVSARL